ncbi:MAG: hypothetical protein AAFR15_14295 [Cyanobacteria bacterium J06627_15]
MLNATVPSLTAVERKFLDELWAQPGYRAEIETIRPNPKTSATDRDRICQQLYDRELVDYTYDVTQFAIAPSGRLLLNLQTTSLPLTPMELWTLRACRSHSISPARLPAKVPVQDRQRVIRQLASRRLLTLKKQRIQQVWLTLAGQRLCQRARFSTDRMPVSRPLMASQQPGNDIHPDKLDRSLLNITEPGKIQPDDIQPDDVLAWIHQLDEQVGTHNALPIFRLREWLQPPLTRSQVDQHLQTLQHQGRVELTALQDVSLYSDRQLAEGMQIESERLGYPGLWMFFVGLI